jgi:hypothetical protein
LIAKVVALRAENQHQKLKRVCRKGTIQKGGSITIQDGQESIQNKVVAKQSQINAKNIDLVLLNEEPRTARVKALSRCSRCGSFKHTTRTCSL